MHIDKCPYSSLKPRAVFKIWKDTKSLFLTILFTWWMDNILKANCYPLSICKFLRHRERNRINYLAKSHFLLRKR